MDGRNETQVCGLQTNFANSFSNSSEVFLTEHFLGCLENLSMMSGMFFIEMIQCITSNTTSFCRRKNNSVDAPRNKILES